MNDNKKTEVDSETILMTLDQLGQTIEIMTTVVGRLRHYVSEQQNAGAAAAPPPPTSSSAKNSLPKNKAIKDIEERLKPISTTLH